MSHVIAIDGPAASGKTSVGFKLAHMLGCNFLDAGSVYRAGCLQILRRDLAQATDAECAQIFSEIIPHLHIDNTGHRQKLFQGSEDVTDFLNTPEVTEVVSLIGGRPEVRNQVKHFQREFAESGKTVITGRDIGTEIFPEAALKIFLTASPEARARRRHLQLVSEGKPSNYQQLLTDLVSRDERDMTRATSPMRIPENAKIVDSTLLNLNQVVDSIHIEYALLFGVQEGRFRRV